MAVNPDPWSPPQIINLRRQERERGRQGEEERGSERDSSQEGNTTVRRLLVSLRRPRFHFTCSQARGHVGSACQARAGPRLAWERGTSAWASTIHTEEDPGPHHVLAPKRAVVGGSLDLVTTSAQVDSAVVRAAWSMLHDVGSLFLLFLSFSFSFIEGTKGGEGAGNTNQRILSLLFPPG